MTPDRRRTRARRMLLAAAAVTLALAPAAPAAAHDELVSSTPADGATVRTLQQVDLTFEEPPLELGAGRNAVQVVDRSGRHYETACTALRGRDLVAPVALGGAGVYTVLWRVQSDDGHAVGGSYDFTYRPASGASAAPGAERTPCATAASITRAAAPAGASPVLIAAIGGGLLLAVLAAAVVIVLRLRA